MVDFSKRLGTPPATKILDPVSLYDTLDRASDKGPLRDIQKAILADWHAEWRGKKDLILKLHTGQGKTLIGLLMLQSKLLETSEPTVYLCPNNFLIRQTCEQAKQFGITVCTTEGDLPTPFLDGKEIFVTSVQKLFNGLTKFGLGPRSTPLHSILFDDAHACIDAIRESFVIRIDNNQQTYADLLTLFSNDLERQGAGTFADIKNHIQEAVLAVPYWAVADKEQETATILSKHSKHISVKFAWPLLKDILGRCQIVFSGQAVEISPILPPLEQFGSYFKAKHRIYMSATITDDSFLVKGLRLSAETIQKPLAWAQERWSGEKMILIPSLIDDSLDRGSVVAGVARHREKAKWGIVALVPSAASSKDWEKYGAIVANRDTITDEVKRLRDGSFDRTLVIVNRYDGIDLPDETCRLLVVDSKPYSECLWDIYEESCRSSSDVSTIRVARSIEQGLGRSVRGEKDFCVILLVGADLIRAIRTKELRHHISNQTAAQIDLGLEIVEMSKEDIQGGESASKVFFQVINQCLNRDDSWKAFYKARMDAVDFTPRSSSLLESLSAELQAEQMYASGRVDDAVGALQKMLDAKSQDEMDKGWHMQTMARYLYSTSATRSNEMQIAAHKKNTYVLKPRSGMQMQTIAQISEQRVATIIKWAQQFGRPEELDVTINAILDKVAFGVSAETFERSLNELANCLGFLAQRPDKEWGEGPDNLWKVKSGCFLLFECKSEVDLQRSEITKREAEQMNRSLAWFSKYYPGTQVSSVMIIPTHVLSTAAEFLGPVAIMNDKLMRELKVNVRKFFAELKTYDLLTLSEQKVQDLLGSYHLLEQDLQSRYTRDAVAKRRG